MVNTMMNEIYKGTTTVGLICKDGVVLATERRATMGNYIASKSAKKIFRIADRVAMTTAGAVGDAQFLARLISIEAKLYEIKKEEEPTIRAIATLLSNILNSVRFFPYFVQLLVGGVDKRGPSIYSIDLIGGAIEEKDIVATGSGSPTAYGVLEDRYSPDMTTDEGVELAVRAIYSAMRRDSASGDGIDVVKITKDKYVELKPEEVEEIIKRFNRR
ncbi:MAG TPA: archaeal proteasome endopeptidase complex subunit beta [Archaeoglobus profundus]|nr:archaeal proteasome endopeptidase complex subunit beta [Archaeoglobus profundus]HIP58135.1 archaeal proteasome endopeptidase complex subunit beta [Archaeoglobus profundus]